MSIDVCDIYLEDLHLATRPDMRNEHRKSVQFYGIHKWLEAREGALLADLKERSQWNEAER
jgi:hypothetical protein